MDYRERIAQLRDRLLHDRKTLIASAVLLVLLSTTTLIAGIVAVRHAVQEDRITTRASNAPSEVGLLLEDSPNELFNHIVFFNDVRLEAGPTNDVYFATSRDGESILVLSTGAKSASALNADSVDVQGTVRAVPPLSTLTKKWKLSKDQVKAIRKQGVYIEAESIRVKRNSPQSIAKK
jgi:hypothetical protein